MFEIAEITLACSGLYAIGKVLLLIREGLSIFKERRRSRLAHFEGRCIDHQALCA